LRCAQAWLSSNIRFLLLKLLMLLKLVLSECANHAAIDFLNNHLRQPYLRRFLANPIDNLLHAFRRTHGGAIGFKRGSGFNAFCALSDRFDQFAIYPIDTASDVFNAGKSHFLNP
jgi:hypothetical protein